MPQTSSDAHGASAPTKTWSGRIAASAQDVATTASATGRQSQFLLIVREDTGDCREEWCDGFEQLNQGRRCFMDIYRQ